MPNSEDALLTLYESEVFKKFSYWDQHLFLFNAQTLNTLATISGFSLIKIKHVQRYPLSNHLYWLSKGLPGGHEVWSNLNSNEINQAYSSKLAALGQTDTIFGILKLNVMTRTLMVLAGGFGTRLRSVTGPKPKALASISGKPFLSILMEKWISHGFERFVFLLGYGSQEIIDTLNSYEFFRQKYQFPGVLNLSLWVLEVQYL